MNERIYSVTELNRITKECIETQPKLKEFFLKGELSNVTYYKSGHLYFTLKDKQSQIKCVAFNYKFKKISSDLKEGEQIKLFGDVGFYETRGDLQVLVRYVEKENQLGELYRKLEELKQKLEKEGVFSSLYKKPLPKYPKSIGVVTAYTGAAFHDIINTTRKRFENIDIYIYSAKVQGPGAKEEIVKGIETLNKIEDIDLIIAGRGGGSIEDLWAFNEEEVARAFYSSKKPIISAVGHEIDNLLTDLVADVRAATPTQAIEIAIPVKKDIEDGLLNKKNRLENEMKKIIKNKKEKLNELGESYILKNFIKIIEKNTQELFLKEENLEKAMKIFLENKKYEFNLCNEKIMALNPLRVLSRGYSVSLLNEKVIKNTTELKIGDTVETILQNGKFTSEVKEIKLNEKK